MTFYLSDRQKMKMSYRSYCWQKCGEKMCLVTQSCPTLWDPMDCSLPGSSVHGILQVITLEWVDISSSRGSSRARDQTCDSCVSCTAGGFFMAEPSGNPRMFRLYNTISFKVVQHDSLMYVYIATVDV